MKRLLLLSLLLLSTEAIAYDGTLFKYLVNANTPYTTVKSLSIAKQSEFTIFETKYELGAIFDQRSGAKTMGFGMGGIGIEPRAGALYVNFFQNIALMSSTDAYLGSLYQFSEQLGLGIKDKNTQVGIGLTYTHISNAGIVTPNKGKDLMGIQVSIPW